VDLKANLLDKIMPQGDSKVITETAAILQECSAALHSNCGYFWWYLWKM